MRHIAFQLVEDEMSAIRIHVRESMENKTTFKELVTNIKYRKAIYIVLGKCAYKH